MRHYRWVGLLVFFLATLMSGCGSDDAPPAAPAAPTDNATPTGDSTGILSAEVQTAITRALQDEYRARETYLKVIQSFGEIQPFVSIAQAEQQHINEVGGLLVVRGLGTPQSEWNSGNVPTYASVQEACQAAVQGETGTVSMYENYLLLELPDDVRAVFERQRDISKNRHLPAFERCS